MLIPYSTDAPLYYRPFATLGIITANTLLFLTTMAGTHHIPIDNDAPYRWLFLEYDRINPLQWVTAAFMHATWSHLIGNMLFLWCFGLIVEGKLGWRRFLMLYLGLALADGAISQVPMFFLVGEGTALGASGVIFALLTIAMIWAPENEVSCIFPWGVLFLRATIDVPIFAFGGFYLALNLYHAWQDHFVVATAMLHLMGATVGLPFAIYMLKNNRVDCEGFDLLSRNPQIANQISGLNPLFWVGRLFRDTPARDDALFRIDSHAESTNHSALDTIKANPTAFNPEVAPARSLPQPSPPSPEPMPMPQRDGLPDFLMAESHIIPQAKRSTRVAPKEPEEKNKAIALWAQAIRQDDLTTAMRSFERLEQARYPGGLPMKMIAHYVNLLARHQRHLESVGPLEILISQPSNQTGDACIRLALIHWKLNRDPEATLDALAQIPTPMSREQKRRKQRLLNELDRPVLGSRDIA